MATISKSTISGLKKLVDQMRGRAAKMATDANVSVAVGYHAAYALYVHENIEMKLKGLPRRPPAKGEYWGPHGQAKFLEEPFRRLANDGTINGIIATAAGRGLTLAQALVLAGLRVQRESQQLVPIDTGNLRASAFTVLET